MLDQVVQYTRALEVSPDHEQAAAYRAWVLEWIVGTPDYTVVVCSLFDTEKTASDDAEITAADYLAVQVMFGNVAFQVDYGTTTDELSRQLAGVESALKAYAAMRRDDPTLRVAGLDAMVEARAAGGLPGHVRALLETRCAGVLNHVSTDAEPLAFFGGYLRSTSVVYPLRVGAWQAGRERRYESPDEGASVRYQHGDEDSRWIDVYFYPKGLVNEGVLEALAAQERQQLIDVWSARQTEDLEMTRLEAFDVPSPGRGSTGSVMGSNRALTAYVADFVRINDGQAMNSVVAMTVDKMYAIKVRYSAQPETASRAEVRGAAMSFLKQLLEGLVVQNKGACSAVPALRTLAKGESAPRDVIASSRRDGEDAPSGWLSHREMVIKDMDALDVLPSLQQVVDERLRDSGCVTDETELPAVEEGMREMRLEYRVSP